MKHRVVVTGTRDTREALAMKDDLRCALDKCLAALGPLVLAEGVCTVRGKRAGVDTLAWQWALTKQGAGVVHDPHPITRVDWEKHGKGAGPVRNRRMLRPGATLVLAVPHRTRESRGTRDCMRAAEGLGIPVIERADFAALNDFLCNLVGDEPSTGRPMRVVHLPESPEVNG